MAVLLAVRLMKNFLTFCIVQQCFRIWIHRILGTVSMFTGNSANNQGNFIYNILIFDNVLFLCMFSRNLIKKYKKYNWVSIFCIFYNILEFIFPDN
jgi:hypothetical protein